MAEEIRFFTADDGARIFFRYWRSEGEKVGAVHILHGMAEHSGRYDQFASFLAEAGYEVYAQDHRGHGLTAKEAKKPFGFFAQEDGWNRIMSDSMALDRIILQEQSKTIPLFLLGHSMGSFLARSILVRQSGIYRGAIIMGSGAGKGIVGKFGSLLAQAHIRFMGPKTPDPQLSKLSFGSFLRHIPHPRTSSDWLTRDSKAVDLYRADPLCGFTCTTSFFRDLLFGVAYANDRKKASAIAHDLPILVISGSEDPVGGWSKGVRKVYALYKGVGIRDVTLFLVEGARHELLGEVDKEQTWQYLLDWMEARRT